MPVETTIQKILKLVDEYRAAEAAAVRCIDEEPEDDIGEAGYLERSRDAMDRLEQLLRDVANNGVVE